MDEFETALADSAESVIRQYADMVYRPAYAQTRSKSDADDIFQGVFVRYIRKKPTSFSEEHRKAWLLRVTLNCSKKRWGSWWLRHTVPLEESIPVDEPEESRVDEALKSRSPTYRTVIHPFYYEGYSTSEIAHLTDSRESTVHTRLTRTEGNWQGTFRLPKNSE